MSEVAATVISPAVIVLLARGFKSPQTATVTHMIPAQSRPIVVGSTAQVRAAGHIIDRTGRNPNLVQTLAG